MTARYGCLDSRGGATWSEFYGGMCLVPVDGGYYMYDTLAKDHYSVALLSAPVIPEPARLTLLGGPRHARAR